VEEIVRLICLTHRGTSSENSRDVARQIAALYAPIIAERDEALARVREVEWSPFEPDELEGLTEKWPRIVHVVMKAEREWEAAEARAEALHAQVEGMTRALVGIQRCAFSDGSRTFDDCKNALAWIDDQARQALSTLTGGEK
jgi:hypothetical protein